MHRPFAPIISANVLRSGGFIRGYMDDFISRLEPRCDKSAADTVSRSSEVVGSAIDNA
jgi:hypothetical protein